MERKHQITIPEPCHENWDKMTPSDNGRFCMSCSKTVIDFSTMLPNEIKHFFVQKQDTKICGRFRNEQLESLIIQIPIQILHTQTNYHKMFLLALFIAMGTTLFSCQNKDGKKQKIDKVEVVKDTSTPMPITVGEISITKYNPGYVAPPPPPPKVDQVKFVKPGAVVKNAKTLKSKTDSCTKTQKTAADSIQYDGLYTTGVVYISNNVTDPADYPGGQNKLYRVFKQNFIIPEKASDVEGELELGFDINELGKLNNIKIIKDLGEEITQEGIRVLGSLAKWKPGIVNNKRIVTPYKLKIIFSRESDSNGVKIRELKSQIVSIKLNPELE